MSESVDKVYSEAIFSIAVETNKQAVFDKELREIAEVFEANPELYKLCSSPAITLEEKLSVAGKIFRGTDETVLNFICVLIQNRRTGYIKSIADDFHMKYNKECGIIDVRVISAQPLTDEQKKKVAETMTKKTGKTVVLSEETDPSIIGGMIIEYDNMRIDGSIKNRLKQFERELKI